MLNVMQNNVRPLKLAVDNGSAECVRLLVAHKANVELETVSGDAENRSLIPVQDGRRALHWAAGLGELDVLRTLLEGKADPTAIATVSCRQILLNRACVPRLTSAIRWCTQRKGATWPSHSSCWRRALM